MDKTVYPLTIKAGETATLKVSDTPKVTDTLIELFKIDMETQKDNPQGNASLAGAEFTWKYYAGTHKKTVIALWVVLITSVSFGAYKNFTAIDQHTTHEKEIIELRLQDTNGIENFVKNFAKSYYTWSNSKEAIEARTQAISGYLTKELQDLNVDTIRTDIPVSYTHLVIIWKLLSPKLPSVHQLKSVSVH